MPNTYQEPIEKEDLDLKNKFSGPSAAPSPKPEKSLVEEEIPPQTPVEKIGEAEKKEQEASQEQKEENVEEKIEETRKTLGAQKTPAQMTVSDDAQTVSDIDEYEKKVEKLIELALQKGPEHAINVARHLDKKKNISEADNYTLDEIHDKMIEDELRKQLIAKGLLKEL